MNNQTPFWKPLLIILIVGLFGYTASFTDEYRLGIDLAGGTTMTYDVDTSGSNDPKEALEDLIESYKRRINPNGLFDITWRVSGSSRISVSMPAANKKATAARKGYTEVLNKLQEKNLSLQVLENIARMETGATRTKALNLLKERYKDHAETFSDFIAKFDLLKDKTGPYNKATAAWQKALKDEIIADPKDKAKLAEIKVRLEDAKSDSVITSTEYDKAYEQYKIAKDKVADKNLDIRKLQSALDKPAKRFTDDSTADALAKKDDSLLVSHRTDALNDLKKRYPSYTKIIDEVATQHTIYRGTKGGGLDDPNDLKKLLEGSGVLEFRIAANSSNVPASEVEKYRKTLREVGHKQYESDARYRWFVVDDIDEIADTKEEKLRLEQDAAAYFNNRYRGMIGQAEGNDYYILLGNAEITSEDTIDDTGNAMTGNNKDWEIKEAYGVNNKGKNELAFQLNNKGGVLMGLLTGHHLKQPMAIVLDGRIFSWPNINSRINGSGTITGGGVFGFAQDELKNLKLTLEAGSLQSTLIHPPISEQTVEPELGSKNVQQGLNAAVYAIIAVAVFMSIYYFMCGMVANFALLANMAIILGMMVLTKATFTLPGIAGIVLTIGMAVDANVLIFERIREEMADGLEIHSAIKAGFGKALATILDANITTMITCIVLAYFATTEVKGFAVTLMIGIIATMFTALFCTQTLLNIWVNMSKTKKLNMLPTISKPIASLLSPKFNWSGAKSGFFSLSAIMIAVGVISIASRGKDMLDIEFRSGTQVTFEIAESKAMTAIAAREKLDTFIDGIQDASVKKELAALKPSNGARLLGIEVADFKPENGKIKRKFTIKTLVENSEQVSNAIKGTFADAIGQKKPVMFLESGTVDSPNKLMDNAPVHIIKTGSLGQNIKTTRFLDDTKPIGEFVGGVLVVLENFESPVSLKSMTARVDSIKNSKTFADQGIMTAKVLGLGVSKIIDGEEAYEAYAIACSDGHTNYLIEKQALRFTENDKNLLSNRAWNLARDAMLKDTSLGSVNNFSSQISGTMIQQAYMAIILSLVAVVFYIWLRFGSFRYGFAAIAALTHDVIISLGVVALVGSLYTPWNFQIDLSMVAAVLTIIGYSLNDTIVIFDRIRENRGRMSAATPSVVNNSINQTISRTALTSCTTLLALLTLFIFGGDGVAGFSFSMIIGVMVGTYSSIAIAAPLLLVGGSKTPPTLLPEKEDDVSEVATV